MPRSPHCTIRVFDLNISVKVLKLFCILGNVACFLLCFPALTSVDLDVYLVRKKVKRKDFVPRLKSNSGKRYYIDPGSIFFVPVLKGFLKNFLTVLVSSVAGISSLTSRTSVLISYRANCFPPNQELRWYRNQLQACQQWRLQHRNQW